MLAPLVRLSVQEAKAEGEQPIQLRENGRYEYSVRSITTARGQRLKLVGNLVRSRKRRESDRDIGRIETASHCGLLRLDIEEEGHPGERVATGYVEVRSLKVSYRDEYQRMLEYISAQSSQLLFDARASAQMPVTPKWTREPPLLQHPGSDADRKGQDERANEFRGFHEILPGLGAFAISPGPDGSPKGMEHLNRFLADVLEHLSTRTTSRERVSYHLREAYGGKALGEATVEYRIKQSIPERDTATGERLVPPSEHPVLVGWYENADDRHLAWILSSGFYNFRAGDRNGSIRLEPRIAGAKHLLLHTQGGTAHPKLVTAMLRKRGWRVVRIWEHALARKHEARLVASLRRFLRA